MDDIKQARQVINGRVHRTPMLTATLLGDRLGVKLLFKAELFQKTGSFKPRGAINKLNSLSADEKANGVVSMSAGNFAAGLAYAASAMGVKATIVMPEAAVKGKVAATRAYGATAVLHGVGKDLVPKAMELAAQVAKNASLTNFAVLQALPMIAEANPQTGLLMESLMATVAQSDKEAKLRIRAFLDRKTAKVKPA